MIGWDLIIVHYRRRETCVEHTVAFDKKFNCMNRQWQVNAANIPMQTTGVYSVIWESLVELKESGCEELFFNGLVPGID